MEKKLISYWENKDEYKFTRALIDFLLNFQYIYDFLIFLMLWLKLRNKAKFISVKCTKCMS